MFRTVVATVLSMGFSSTALAGPVVVWLEGEVPEERLVRRADSMAGDESLHLSQVDLAFPPQPATAAQDEKMEALEQAMLSARGRWDEFDVELGIAKELEGILFSVDLVRDAEDLETVVDARLFQGAAVSRAFSAEGFRSDEAAAPFRTEIVAEDLNAPWVQAWTLAPEREFVLGDVVDGAAFPALQSTLAKIDEAPTSILDLTTLPRGASIVFDGQTLAPGTETLEVRPGTHYLHVVRNGVISGRQRVELEAGVTTRAPTLVSDAELASARKLASTGSAKGFPDDVVTALEAIAAHHDGRVYVATTDDKGKPVVLPWKGGGGKSKFRWWTVNLFGDMGGGIMASHVFDGGDGSITTAPAASGSLGLEWGITYAVIFGGVDLFFTPGQTITHADAKREENIATSVSVQPWGGVGAYILRPEPGKASLLLGGSYGWQAPAHFGWAGRLAIGVPIDKEGTWFRIALGGSGAPDVAPAWQEAGNKVPLYTGYLRFGFNTGF